MAAAADAGLGAGSFREGVTLGAADKLDLGVGLDVVGLEVVVGTGLDTTLGDAGDTAGLVASVDFIEAELLVTLLSDFCGRGS